MAALKGVIREHKRAHKECQGSIQRKEGAASVPLLIFSTRLGVVSYCHLSARLSLPSSAATYMYSATHSAAKGSIIPRTAGSGRIASNSKSPLY